MADITAASNSTAVSTTRAAAIPVELREQRRAVNVLGICIDATNLPDATALLVRWVAERKRSYVCVTGVHGVMESQREPDLRRIHNEAGMVTPDGMPLVYLARAAGQRGCGRVYGPDFLIEVCRASVACGSSHFFYGTTPATLAKLTDHLSDLLPGIKIAGSYAPPFRALSEAERGEVVGLINASGADIVWVGLSTPKQERWMAQNRPALDAPVLVGVGAAFDVHAGTLRRSPKWIQPLCLEWLFRLAIEPRRLWKRYLINNPQFIFAVALQLLRLKRY